MASLPEILQAPSTKPLVVRSCVELVDEEVGSKRGLTGAAVRAAYSVVKTVSPTIVRDVVEKLLPEFAAALDPMFQESVKDVEGSKGQLPQLFRDKLERERSRAADALLAVTDRRIDRARRPIQRAYQTLRSGAREHVMQAVPGLGRKLSAHVSTSAGDAS